MPWPETGTYFGRSTPRLEGAAKVTGRARYTSDVALPGMLYAVIVRSRWPAAKIRAVDLSRVLAAPGIRAAVRVREGEFDVYYYGAELAAIAGVSRTAVLDALELVAIRAEPRAFVVDEVEAAQAAAPRVVPDRPNLAQGAPRTEGGVDAAFSTAAAVATVECATQVEIHHPLEPHGHVTQWDGDELTAWSSTQGIFGCRNAFARELGLSQNRVRVICEHMGGGFGAKFSPNAEGILCARLAKIAGAPVKLILSRHEQALAVGNRPSSLQKLRLAADPTGRLTGFELESFGTPGHGSGVTSAGGSGGASFPAPYIYRPAAIRVRQGSVAVNAGPSCPMRAPGHPVASVGMEAVLDELAYKLGMDPVALRIQNDPSEIRRREYELGAARIGWKEKFRAPGASPGTVKTGLGCAGAAWMSGGRGTQAELEVHSDGTLEIRVGTQDLGTGSRTVIQVVAAEMLGIDPRNIAVRVGDTRFPASGASGGSATTASVAPAIYDGCERLLAEISKTTGGTDARGRNWSEACARLRAGSVVVRGQWREGLSAGGAGGVQFAEVAVDTETGFVQLRKIVAVQDCGAVVNRLTCESQINGGVIMGIGYALYERRVMDRQTGVVLNPNFETYKLPGAADIPEIDILLLDMPERGVIGVGEPCTIPTASAIANAVANAIGVRVPSLPLTPDRILAALGQVPATTRGLARAKKRRAAFAALINAPVGAFPDQVPT